MVHAVNRMFKLTRIHPHIVHVQCTFKLLLENSQQRFWVICTENSLHNKLGIIILLLFWTLKSMFD